MEYIETGAEFGVSLKRDSIASRLSKLVRDGVFANEDGRYVLIDATKLKATKARRKPYNGADDPRDGTLQDLTYFVVEKYGPMKRAQICKKIHVETGEEPIDKSVSNALSRNEGDGRMKNIRRTWHIVPKGHRQAHDYH